MIRVKTLNSTYEVDLAAPGFRRVEGVNPPTDNVGADGLWHHLDRVVRRSTWMGDVLMFVWHDGRWTQTSAIESEEEM